MIRDADQTIVFDTGPLRHFALRGWLGVLKYITSEKSAIIPESVEYELLEQKNDKPSLAQIFDEDWISVDRTDDIDFLSAFAGFEQRLVSRGRNRGECGVLALGKVYGYTVVIDDRVPRTIAKEEGLSITGTLGLLCQAIREDQLTVNLVEQLADDLLSGDYFLPFGPGDFRKWAENEGLIS
jgi:predicted nucleic acid-binding protein